MHVDVNMCVCTGVSFWCAGRCGRESEQPAEDSLWPWAGSLHASALSVTTHTNSVQCVVLITHHHFKI